MRLKQLVLLIVLLVIYCVANAQVKFRDISIQEALKQAGTDDKLVFVYVASEECNQCNEVADEGFENTTWNGLHVQTNSMSNQKPWTLMPGCFIERVKKRKQ